MQFLLLLGTTSRALVSNLLKVLRPIARHISTNGFCVVRIFIFYSVTLQRDMFKYPQHDKAEMRRVYSIITVLTILIFVVTLDFPSALSQGTCEELDNGTSDVLYSVAWKPGGGYALIAGDSGTALKYDGENFEDLSTQTGTTENLRCVSWKPDGSYALISGGDTYFGGEGVLLKYDGSSFTNLSVNINSSKEYTDIGWNPSGSYALIIGGGLLRTGEVIRYDGTSFEELPANLDKSLSGIGWNHQDNYALIVGKQGTVIKYDGSVFTNLTIGVTYDLKDAFWSPDYTYALIFGQQGLSGKLLRYDGTTFTDISNQIDNLMYGFEWQPSGDYAMAVGAMNEVSIYDGTGFSDIDTPGGWFYDVSWEPSGNSAIIVGQYGRVLRFTPNSGTTNGPMTTPPSGDGFALDPMMLTIIIAIVAVAVIVVLLVTMKKGRADQPEITSAVEEEQEVEPIEVEVMPETPLQQPEAYPKATPAQQVGHPQGPQFQCPNCHKVFLVASTNRPLDIKCPHCGVEGILE